MSHRHRSVRQQLTTIEKDRICTLLDRHPNSGIDTVYHTYLNQGHYYASLRTWYRIAKDTNRLMKQRWGNGRRITRRTPRNTPVLQATVPTEVVCWDITWLPSDIRKISFPAYIFIDLYSRSILAGLVATREDKNIAAGLIDHIAGKYPTIKVLHSDNGAIMTSTKVASTCGKYKIDQSFIRPGVSDDNPHCESFHGTLKTRPDYPGCFSTVEEANQWLYNYIAIYNNTPHTGLCGYTPNEVFTNTWKASLDNRKAALDTYYRNHPDRKPARCAEIKAPPQAVSINIPRKGTPAQPTIVQALAG